MDNTKIEWTDSTFNPWIGCTKISPACDNCYAEELMDKRMQRAEWGAGKPRSRTSAANWKDPVRWNAQPFVECMSCHWRGESRVAPMKDSVPGTEVGSGPWRCCPRCHEPLLKETRRRVFCASLADVFDNEVDPQWRTDLFSLIRATPNLDWLLLTKRIGNAHQMIGESLIHLAGGTTDLLPSWPWGNVWIGATICNQEETDRDIPKLLATPARVRFLSIEPMLGPIDLAGSCRPWGENGASAWMLSRIRWVIVGGESGAHARPMDPAWVRSLRDQCVAAGVSFLFKQWGEWAPNDRGGIDGAALETPYSLDSPLQRFGKKASGRLLDGRQWDQHPKQHPEVLP